MKADLRGGPMDELAPTAAAVTEDDWSAARSRNRRTAYLGAWRGVPGRAARPCDGVPHHAHHLGRCALPGDLGLWMAVLVAPMAIALVAAQREGTGEERRRHRHPGRTSSRLRPGGRSSRAAWPTPWTWPRGSPRWSRSLSGRSPAIVPDAPIELLLADNSHAHLLRMASASPTGAPPELRRRLTGSLPGGAPGPGAAVPRQRGARRVPEAPRHGPKGPCRRCACPSRSWAVPSASST